MEIPSEQHFKQGHIIRDSCISSFESIVSSVFAFSTYSKEPIRLHRGQGSPLFSLLLADNVTQSISLKAFVCGVSSSLLGYFFVVKCVGTGLIVTVVQGDSFTWCYLYNHDPDFYDFFFILVLLVHLLPEPAKDGMASQDSLVQPV